MQEQFARSGSKFNLSPRNVALSAIIVTSVIMSFTGLIVRNIEQADQWQINIYRSIAFIIATVIFISIQNHSRFAFKSVSFNKPILFGGLCLGVTGVIFTQALIFTTISNTMFTMSSIPFVSMILAYLFLKETISARTLAVICISAFGILIMVSEGGGGTSHYGNIMAVLAAIGFACFAVILRANKNIDMMPSLIIAGLVVIVLSLIPGRDILSISGHDLALCILWGAGLSGVAHWVMVIASRYLSAAELTLFLLFEFALGPFWVWRFNGEAPSQIALFGGLLVVTSVLFQVACELRSQK